ncbi:glycosyltransferase involved in cell wall biosynthesis [Clostridium acetobutylicum]|uniref:Glycosyltransferase n=1 Tax=Clostridium acetobutylicum (strain ATCC 824 / DSM 792 / JCM 1419 / IAM 19013 / LMG 5710 / NBRC 13948 / NRRL B-527 / VKM B-1787 / 2291 / W) TaxID=272562 RepID=Q97GG3_CLOAB|nr:glycosyltransferase family 2 protein [Clostridium acetobutylicum]PSM07967.1 glycosyltransferase family 2 protein [Clostridium sp. NJ4]AAK80359.1 Glycosyltransferase [Clostridium acetobutylicum ATCC 824]AEI32321.1 glycosyltransferase [Clostridium acetobutylicum DSM 1731]AWV82199.1 glycosyltransferase family 2 protein [Clostridium acetobutylicum]MBC2394813.1 glycosyltransferase family 2 protein [Clostridium acetobutylicum]
MEGIVSIVFSTYNNREKALKCIESCLKQKYNKLFVIVADDGSNDGSQELFKKIQEKDSRFKFIPLVHKERGIARGKAISLAKKLESEYIYIIDSDMILEDNLIEKCMSFFNKNKNVGALIVPEYAFSEYENFYSKVKVFERNIINNSGEDMGKNSIEAARFWRMDAYDLSGGINPSQISFEETQPTIRYVEKGGVVKRAVFTKVYHDEKFVTLRNLLKKKMYYFSVMDKTIQSEEGGFIKTLKRWYFFRPVLYRGSNLKRYLRHPILTIGMINMYVILTLVGVSQILKRKK